MENQRLQKRFVVAETMLFLVFVCMDLKRTDSSVFKYIGIVFCLVFALIDRNAEGSIAFVFTLLADWFLLIRNSQYLYGVLFFVAVQLIYAHILVRRGCRSLLPCRLCLLVLSQGALFLLKRYDLLNAITLFYFSLLLGNLFSSLTNKKLRIMSAGFLLFVCCDICVGLFNLLERGPAYDAVSLLMWIFYLPSQVLLAIGQTDHLD